MDMTIWSILKSDWVCSLQPKGEKLYTVSKNKTWELTVAQITLKTEEVRKTTKQLRYDVNQIPYDYTEEVTTRFKGSDLVDRVPEELWTEVLDAVQEAVTKINPPKKKKTQQGKVIVWEGFTNSWGEKRS